MKVGIFNSRVIIILYWWLKFTFVFRVGSGYLAEVLFTMTDKLVRTLKQKIRVYVTARSVRTLKPKILFNVTAKSIRGTDFTKFLLSEMSSLWHVYHSDCKVFSGLLRRDVIILFFYSSKKLMSTKNCCLLTFGIHQCRSIYQSLSRILLDLEYQNLNFIYFQHWRSWCPWNLSRRATKHYYVEK